MSRDPQKRLIYRLWVESSCHPFVITSGHWGGPYGYLFSRGSTQTLSPGLGERQKVCRLLLSQESFRQNLNPSLRIGRVMLRFQLEIAGLLAASAAISALTFFFQETTGRKIQLPSHDDDDIGHDPFDVTAPTDLVDGYPINEPQFWSTVCLPSNQPLKRSDVFAGETSEGHHHYASVFQRCPECIYAWAVLERRE
jgi:hypothetical protein